MELIEPDLLCPRDASPLAIREWGPAWYGFCERCGGIWIGREQFDALVEHGSSPVAVYPEGDFQILEDTALCSCPGQPLMSRVTRDDLSIDVCPACHAIWFDAGEVQCILAAQREAELRKGLPPIAEPPGPLEEAGLVFDLFELVAFVLRVFGKALG